MKIDKTQIKGRQFMFAIACFLYGSSFLTSFYSLVALNESWLMIMISIVVALPLFLIFKWLIIKFPTMNLFQIFERVYGKVFGKIISCFVLFFFMILISLNLTDISFFSKITILNKTPDIVIITLCVLVAALAVKYGIKVVTRYTFIVFVLAFSFLFFAFILLLGQLDFLNFLPIFNLPTIKYFQSVNTILTIPFGEVVALLMISPNVKIEREKVGKYLFGGFLIGVVGLLIIKIRDIGVLGELFNILLVPPLASLRLVDLGEALSRMELFFAITSILLLFYKISLMFYAIVIGFCQIFEVENFRRLILVIACLVITFSYTFTTINPMDKGKLATETVPIVWALFEYLIPLVTLIIAIAGKKTELDDRKKIEGAIRRKNLKMLKEKKLNVKGA
jgi:spore germination protein KB